jgi:hypothetical protein
VEWVNNANGSSDPVCVFADKEPENDGKASLGRPSLIHLGALG